MITFFNDVLFFYLYSVCRSWFCLFFHLHAFTFIVFFLTFSFCSHFHIHIFHILSNDNSLFCYILFNKNRANSMFAYTSFLFTTHGVNKKEKSSTPKREKSPQGKKHSVRLYFMQYQFLYQKKKIPLAMRF